MVGGVGVGGHVVRVLGHAVQVVFVVIVVVIVQVVVHVGHYVERQQDKSHEIEAVEAIISVSP